MCQQMRSDVQRYPLLTIVVVSCNKDVKRCCELLKVHFQTNSIPAETRVKRAGRLVLCPLATRQLHGVKMPCKHINSRFRYCQIIPLCHFPAGMAHLITENMRGRIHFRKPCSVGVPQVVIFEINAQFLLDGLGMIFHGVYCLNFSVRQAVH